jgi:hypothetical protein
MGTGGYIALVVGIFIVIMVLRHVVSVLGNKVDESIANASAKRKSSGGETKLSDLYDDKSKHE